MRQSGGTVITSRPAVARRCGLPATFTVRPSIWRSRSGTSSAITSMTWSVSASAAGRLAAERTASAAQSALRPLSAARLRI